MSIWDAEVRENRLRRMAYRRGMKLTKSARRNTTAIDYGLYALIDMETRKAINPPLAGRFIYSWTLDKVEAWLAADTVTRGPTPAEREIALENRLRRRAKARGFVLVKDSGAVRGTAPSYALAKKPIPEGHSFHCNMTLAEVEQHLAAATFEPRLTATAKGNA